MGRTISILGWFSGAETVLITAGASAPESVVQQCVALLRERFARHGRVADRPRGAGQFPLPRELRRAAGSENAK